MIPPIRLSPSCFDNANRDANVYTRVAVIDLDNDNDNDDFVAWDTLIEILGPSSTATPAIDLDGAFSDLGLTYNSDKTPPKWQKNDLVLGGQGRAGSWRGQ